MITPQIVQPKGFQLIKGKRIFGKNKIRKRSSILRERCKNRR